MKNKRQQQQQQSSRQQERSDTGRSDIDTTRSSGQSDMDQMTDDDVMANQ